MSMEIEESCTTGPLLPLAESDTPDADPEPDNGDEAGPSTPTASMRPEEERQRITDQEELEKAAGLQAGKHYYIIDRRWRLEWLQWIGHQSVQSPKLEPADPVMMVDGDATASSAQPPMRSRSLSWTKERPGPIDNNSLLEPFEPGRLKRNINEHEDYEILSEEVWKMLHTWYQGGPPIKRRAIQQPSGGVVVELYGLSLKVYKSTDLAAGPTSIVESQTTTVGDFKRRICEDFAIEFDKTRIWDYFNKRKYASLESSLDKSLNDCRIYEDNDILIELQLADGSWPPNEEPKNPSVTSYWGGGNSSRWDSSEDVATTGIPLQKGCVGLQNLGNTCFMNSSIQCLANVPTLREYFLVDAWKESVNPTAYKTGGKLAQAFADLLGKMWSTSTVQVAPRNFKWQIGQFAGQFAGYGQQDSMEFIEYFIDGLKEDVNKVKGSKPFVELKEAEGRPDEVVAAEARDHYRIRNNSMIDELFVGYHKSTVRCPEEGCGRVSVTFDPYLSVKLSLVSTTEEKFAKFDVYIVPRASSSKPIQKHKVQAPKFGNAEDLIEAAEKQYGVDAKNCILAEVFSKKIYKYFEASDAIDSIRPEDNLVLYELQDVSEFHLSNEQRWGGTSSINTSADKCGLVIHNRQIVPQQYSSTPAAQLLGLPFLACVDQRMTGNELIEAVKCELAKHLGHIPDEGWTLCRTSEKWNIQECKAIVPADDEILNLESRHYLVVEWEEGVELPEALAKLNEETASRNNGNATNGAGRGAGSISLEKCFDMYVQEDQLSSMDTWYCNRCKEQREAFKKMEFWSFPPVLVLQLKRFTYTQYSRDRLDTAVTFPLEGLDLTKYCLNPDGKEQIFDLVSVSKHIGGLGGGHYVAYARSSECGKWYFFNDSSVTEVTPEQVARDEVGAYVLFYVRRDLRPACWGPPAAN